MNNHRFRLGCLVFLSTIGMVGCDSVKAAFDDILSQQEYIGMPKPSEGFAIENCTLTYNGQVLDYSKPIEQWERVLGAARPASPSSKRQVWDEHGLRVSTRNENGAPSSLTFFFYKYMPYSEKDIAAAYGDQSKTLKRHINEAKPKNVFTSSIWFNGAEISAHWDLNKVNGQMAHYNENNKNWLQEAYAPTIFVANKRCNLKNYPDYRNKEMIFRIDVEQHDRSLVQVFTVGLSLEDL
ncbi:hypothetical protein PN836_006030 [Ningiella sp. W23]|uniref:DUF7738 domain-containing protein n=1 Tax=Ningiella sp. W23 TaxID=3023715 RepID=UPI0037567F2C